MFDRAPGISDGYAFPIGSEPGITKSALMDSLEWTVPKGNDALVLTMHRVHPFGSDWDRLDISLTVNGIELEPVAFADHSVTFRLYTPIAAIHRINIGSSTFIPNELDGSNDTRTLGIPVVSIETTRLADGFTP